MWGNLSLAKAKARDAQRKDDLGWVADAVVRYFRDNGTYPPEVGEYQIGGCGEGECPTDEGAGTACNWWSNAVQMQWGCGGNVYLKPLPRDPGNLQTPGLDAYRYVRLEEGGFAVEACLEVGSDDSGKPVGESVTGFTPESCPSETIFKLP
jgi:NADPH-dependent 2,4-dienoyl-CoA reductase/sulfur reductase-like enzyme